MAVISPVVFMMSASHSADSLLFTLHAFNLLCDVNS